MIEPDDNTPQTPETDPRSTSAATTDDPATGSNGDANGGEQTPAKPPAADKPKPPSPLDAARAALAADRKQRHKAITAEIDALCKKYRCTVSALVIPSEMPGGGVACTANIVIIPED